jgi:DNA-binding transcriptional regulator YiaG
MHISFNRIPPKVIRRLRDALAESQAAFAQRMGVSQATVSRWEDGELIIQGPAKILLERMLQDVDRFDD